MKNHEELTTGDLYDICQNLIMNKHDGLIEEGLMMFTERIPHPHTNTAIGKHIANFLNRFQPGMFDGEGTVGELFAQHRSGINECSGEFPMLDSQLSDKWLTDIPGFPDEEPWFIHHNPDTTPLRVMMAMLATDTDTKELAELFASLEALHSDERFLIMEGSVIISNLITKAHDGIFGLSTVLPLDMDVCDALIANIGTLVDAMGRVKTKLDGGWKPDTGDARMMAMLASQYSDVLFQEYEESSDTVAVGDCLDSRCLDIMQTAVRLHDDDMLAGTLAFRKTACILLGIRQYDGGMPLSDNLFHDKDGRIMEAIRAMLDDVDMPDEFTLENTFSMLNG